AKWSALMAELSRVLGLGTHLATVREVCDKLESSGAPRYAVMLKQPIAGTVDGLLPDNWRKAWSLRRLNTYLESIDAHEELKKLAKNRHEVERDLSRSYGDTVVKRTWLKLAENASPSIRAALQAYLTAIQHIGKGMGVRAVRYRQNARMAASQANPAVPCWIMAHYRVSESLPAELGCFHLVVIDEASQSDLTALPSLLRAKKVLIVGDDKQVSPEGVGLEEKKILSLMDRFLDSQVKIYRDQMSPANSIYDLFKVVFAKSAVMLKEHFRCVAPIIEYSKREFYNHELRPLRVPKASERLDPPLIDVLVEDGYRNGDVNLPEARFIVDEIKAIVADPNMAGRSIGVVSLLADKQALLIWERLTDELGPEVMQRHRIACGDARTFQGNEREIMFLSMVSAPNEVGAPLSRDTFAQRFNVAASRARDRMYLVRSVDMEHLSEKDRLRRSLIAHFVAPFAQDEIRVEDLRKLCESPFEREMYDELTQRGYRVTPELRVGQYRIDMVVEGQHDARLAIECDGDKYHGPDKWADDMQRQRVLERAGWVFWRCFATAFIRRRSEVLGDLLKTLAERGIEPIGTEGAPRSVHTEHRVVSFVTEPATQGGEVPINVPESVQTSVRAVLPAQRPVRRGEASRQRKLGWDPSTDSPDLHDLGPVLAPSVDLPDAPPAPMGRVAELLGLANRLNVTNAIKSFQERGLTAEETVANLTLKSPSAMDMVKAVRGEAMDEETKRAPVQEPTPPEEGRAAPQAQADEGHLTSDINAVYSGTAHNNARSVKIQEGRRNTMNLIIKFEHERETKGTHRFKEIAEEGKPMAVGTLYIRKEALPTPVPTTIEVTIKS
ncbi:MAG TPA: AAA domain-containing protein, partial [Thermoleophilia bacterium]|nr:AAA domain-containing protein [Thermoleophilia bacterium]